MKKIKNSYRLKNILLIIICISLYVDICICCASVHLVDIRSLTNVVFFVIVSLLLLLLLLL